MTDSTHEPLRQALEDIYAAGQPLPRHHARAKLLLAESSPTKELRLEIMEDAIVRALAQARLPVVDGCTALDPIGGEIAHGLFAIAMERLAEQLDPSDIAIALYRILSTHYRDGGNPRALVEHVVGRVIDGVHDFDEKYDFLPGDERRDWRDNLTDD